MRLFSGRPRKLFQNGAKNVFHVGLRILEILCSWCLRTSIPDFPYLVSTAHFRLSASFSDGDGCNWSRGRFITSWHQAFTWMLWICAINLLPLGFVSLQTIVADFHFEYKTRTHTAMGLRILASVSFAENSSYELSWKFFPRLFCEPRSAQCVMPCCYKQLLRCLLVLECCFSFLVDSSTKWVSSLI